MTGNDLGDFLRAHRARLQPGDVGLASYGTRRVAGLRREEVAVLAGMNGDYYARLEQGRERGPSPQVLDAIGTALRLEPEARAHLHRLAGAELPTGPATQPAEHVGDELRQLLDDFATAPAFVLNPALDVLAANPMAEALFSPFATVDNLARMTFLDPVARRFHTPWERAAEAVVGELRRATGTAPHYPRLQAVLRRLTEESGEFAALWSSHTVHGKSHGTKGLVHPDVGPLSLTFRTFDVRGEPGQHLVVYQAPPGSPTAEALTLLGTLHAAHHRESPADH
ncbi:helix-turn-helix transcriptional regulator [Kitasatospora sp. NPDC054939]